MSRRHLIVEASRCPDDAVLSREHSDQPCRQRRPRMLGTGRSDRNSDWSLLLLTSEGLAELLQMPHNNSPAGETGHDTVVSSGFMRQIRLCCNRQVPHATGRAIHVQGLSHSDAPVIQQFCGS
jgi:hypothetical protein